MAGRWYVEEFDGDDDFLRFVGQFDSVLQAILSGFPPDQVASWYVPLDQEAGLLAGDWQGHDAADWLLSRHPGVRIPWLGRGDHLAVQLGVLPDGELIGKGSAGYLLVLHADGL